jgi:hypothetical protein
MDATSSITGPLKALDAQGGKWHCMSCWAYTADLTSPEDEQRLAGSRTVLPGQLRPSAKRGGTCDAGRHQTGGLLVRALRRQPAAERR